MVTYFYLEPCNHNCHLLTKTSFAAWGLYAATCISINDASAWVGIRDDVIAQALTNDWYKALLNFFA